MESKMLKAFLDQTKIDDKEAEERDLALARLLKDNFDTTLKEMFKPQELYKYINIPSQNPKISEDKPENKKENGTQVRKYF